MKWFVYVIWARDEDGEEVRYYGHTHDMEEREVTHRNSYNGWVHAGRPDKASDAGHACSSVFVMDMGDWNMDVLHELDCDKEEASRVEGNYIRYNKCVNRCVAGRTKAQWFQDNRDSVLQQMKQYHQENRDARLEYGKKYYQATKEKQSARKAEKVPCPCGTLVGRGDIAKHLKSQKHTKRMQQSTSS
jgi:hypothetical protein